MLYVSYANVNNCVEFPSGNVIFNGGEHGCIVLIRKRILAAYKE